MGYCSQYEDTLLGECGPEIYAGKPAQKYNKDDKEK